MVWHPTDEQRAKISAAMTGRVITWGDKIAATQRGKAKPRRAIADRFWEKVDRRGPNECWPWTAAIDTMGYGIMSRPATVGTTRKAYAHRISHELNIGPIPAGLEVLHSCDNRPCVNPAHLSAGTRKQNMVDAGSRGRMNRPLSTVCSRGHVRTPENTRWHPGGYQVCRICARDDARITRANRPS